MLWGYRSGVRSPSSATSGDGHGELHTAQGLEGLDHRVQAPGFHLLVECLFETLEAFGVFVDRADIFLKDDLLRWGGTDHFSEPPEVGRAPIGPAGIADIVSQQEGFETKLGVFEIAEGIFTRPGQVANGFIFDFGDIDRGEITRAREPGQLQASRRSVLTRSPAFLGIKEGATTQQS